MEPWTGERPPLALRPHQHGAAQEQRLLEDEHQHPRQEEALEAPLRIEATRPLALDRAYLDARGLGRGGGVALGLELAPQLEGDLGGGQRVALVVEGSGEGAMEVDRGLTPLHEAPTEVLGDDEHPVGLASVEVGRGLRLGRGARYDRDVGGGTAECRVEEGVGEGYDQEEEDSPAVAKDAAQLAPGDGEDVLEAYHERSSERHELGDIIHVEEEVA